MKPKDEKTKQECLSLNKDTLIIKLPRRSPNILRMIMLACVTTCSMYIFLECLKQTEMRNKLNVLRIKLLEQPCYNHRIPQSEIPYIHYPEPTSYRRNECACTPVRFFVIVAIQRCGSGWFETLLNSHINVSSNGEIFYDEETRNNISVITKTLDKVYNLDWNSIAPRNECTAAVGFKWMVNQGLMDHYKEIAKYFARRKVSVIFLFRRNRLHQLISVLANAHDQLAKQLNGTHKAHVSSQNEADILASYKPVIDTDSLVPKLKMLHDWADGALGHLKSMRHIVLYYEDLIQNCTKLREVMEFLRLPQRKLISRHVKIHTKPLSHLVENWNDVQNALKGTQYERYLNP